MAPSLPNEVSHTPLAKGPGPRWLRRALCVLAMAYYAALIHHPPDARWLRPAAFFTQATSLFPTASSYAIEYRVEVWSCDRSWQAIDPRPYFPIEADNKESRLQRFGHFYEHDLAANQALDHYIAARHAAGGDDGVVGPIGGIRLVKVVRPLPALGASIARYQFNPRQTIDPAHRRNLYNTPGRERTRRCQGS